MPRVIKADPDDKPKEYRAALWTGVILNGLFPAIELISGLEYVHYEMKIGKSNFVVDAVLWASGCGIEIALIVSGCILLWSIYNIVKFLQTADDREERLNIKILTLNALTFLLFVIADAVVLVAYANYLFDQSNSGIAFLLISEYLP